MLKYTNNLDSAVVVLHEIYGINEHISNLCRHLSDCRFDVYCPDLLNGVGSFNYSEEAMAYENFYRNVGFDSAVRQVRVLLEQCRSKYKHVYILGYSVGATIAWLSSKELNLCDGVIGFYGSRIRDYLEVRPKCPVLLFFPTEEISFNVDSLAEKLSAREKVQVTVLQGKHGFADPFSRCYVEQSHKKSETMIVEFVKETAELVSSKG